MSPAQKPTVQGRQLFRAMWRLIRPYWTSPDAKWSLLLLGLAIALQFARDAGPMTTQRMSHLLRGIPRRTQL